MRRNAPDTVDLPAAVGLPEHQRPWQCRDNATRSLRPPARRLDCRLQSPPTEMAVQRRRRERSRTYDGPAAIAATVHPGARSAGGSARRRVGASLSYRRRPPVASRRSRRCHTVACDSSYARNPHTTAGKAGHRIVRGSAETQRHGMRRFRTRRATVRTSVRVPSAQPR